jgi:hypothetical protein
MACSLRVPKDLVQGRDPVVPASWSFMARRMDEACVEERVIYSKNGSVFHYTDALEMAKPADVWEAFDLSKKR